MINKDSFEKMNSQDSPITPVKESILKECAATPPTGIKNKKIETSAKKGSTKKSRHR